MRFWWRRWRTRVGLLAAIFGDLRRRAWWAYRRGATGSYQPLTAVRARRTEQQTYVPTMTASWEAVAARALRVLQADVIADDEGEQFATVVVDVTERPDVYDTPRVLRQERITSAGPAVLGTQWLADLDHERVLLIVTFVEPVTATWAIHFDLPRTLPVLQHVATTSTLAIVWGQADATDAPPAPPTRSEGIQLTITRILQLRAILAAWSEHPRARA